MNMKRIVGIIGLVVALILAAPQARSQVVKIQNVDLSFSTQSYQPAAVNNDDWVVGRYTKVGGYTLGFLNIPGQATQTIWFPGAGGFTRANGINDSGTVVGDFFGTDGVYHGYFFYTSGTYSPAYNLPGFNEQRHKFSTSLFGISAGGNLAGSANPNGNTQGFVVIDGFDTEFYAAGTDPTYAYAINDVGDAVGEFFDSDNTPHGFLRSQGVVTEIAYPGATWTVCNGINNDGVITGIYLDAAEYGHGFTYLNGVFATLDVQPNGLSNSGSYVGNYTAPGGAQRGYEASPTSVQAPVTLNVTDAQSTSLYGMNTMTAQPFVGNYTDANGHAHGMLMFSTGSVVTLDDPDASDDSTVCRAVNATQIAANYTDELGNSKAAIYDLVAETWTPISLGFATAVSAYGMNERGDVSGTYTDLFNNTFGFVSSDFYGTFNTLEVPGATFTIAYGLNNNIDVSAVWGDSAGYVESAVCHEGRGENFCEKRNLPGATNCYVGGIDDDGDLAYTWTDPEGNVHGGYYDNISQSYYLLDFPGMTDYPGGTGTRAYGIARVPRAPGPVIVGRYEAAIPNFNGFEWNIWDQDQQSCVPPPPGMVSWWPGDGNTKDIKGGNNGVLMNGATFALGKVAQAFQFNGGSDRVFIADSPSLAVTASLTLDAWVNAASTPPNGIGNIIFRGDDGPLLGPYTLRMVGSNVSFQINDAAGNIASVQAPLPLNQFVLVAGTLDDATGVMTLYLNGIVAAQTTTTVRPYGTLTGANPGVSIGNSQSDATLEPFVGLIDEVEVLNRALHSSEVLAIYDAGSSGKCKHH
jgi:hypothetical protein